ncbi:pyruvate carboxylase [Lacticaseibacillus chiayiensis]|uniref:Pyruvate carboxylase n=1 Tax=Lacticaseibacillus chiayiensis TaxID=2100821 RepID=A0A4Q1UEX7_9LACO|nr:pyruvate carboxylase [Lacticaseibacillus chiayiensis]QVI35792.1 pyruvate carboxylase [Lacticaseibacillus chiayiensis]RXT30281.1 pyruvate carboxylase [Lacticaseibacillus chiayiensis]UYN57629.1 pyruvate carboxylase [Lacticaseibacillus chiayiensis]
MHKVLVANRGEIAIRIFRACEELGLKTVGIFAKEDALSIHRFKAQESYQVGAGKTPIAAYLDMDDIIRIAKQSGADAIHPGYGLLSENATFARKVRTAGLTFVGPRSELLDVFGDKVAAKEAAHKAGLATIPGTPEPTRDFSEIQDFTATHGFPVMLKAASGGGGKGMRIVHSEAELEAVYQNAVNEAKASFGDDRMYVEKYIASAKHVEVQVLGDEHGHLLHLFERDCSVQRRQQKVVEIAPAVALPLALRAKICQSAVDLMASLHYENAGTVEFLVDGDQYYFIEVNPRVQVEHTITELITGVDIVQSQLRIAAGADLFDDLHLPQQDQLRENGAAIQCRITTEDPENNFMPDTGTINTYRSPGGFGIRLDVGNAYAGAVVSPYFDSLLVKASVHAPNFPTAVAKMQRALHEFQITGVKTNVAFLEHLLATKTFRTGETETAFIDAHPELLQVQAKPDLASRLLWYIGDVTINGFKGVERQTQKYYPELQYDSHFQTTKPQTDLVALLNDKGASGVTDWVKDHQQLLLTDTTFRDAHQSLFATRMRTRDMLTVAKDMGNGLPNLFSMEVWGGATFDVAYRFLNEDPWVRLKKLRAALPHTLLQMLFRGSNAVGYQNYPDNVIKAFIQQAADDGIDVFRIFDSLNWLPQMTLSIDTVKQTGKLAEVTMCYTGDILSDAHPKYQLAYYVALAKQLVDAGADMIAIKDMAGLLKPQAASILIGALKDAVSVPIHLHTHDTTGNGIATYLAAAHAGVDIVDVAQSSFSGTTSQPSLESLYYALSGDQRQPEVAIEKAQSLDRYFQAIRPYYADFGNGVTGPLTDIYTVQMPGGQYSNLQQQARSMGITDFEAVKAMYAQVNTLFGDIIKVTPSSKVVGDMALFMLQNHLTPEMVRNHGEQYDFPASVVDFFKGDLGQPVGGFPKDLQGKILKEQKPLTVRPGQLAKPVDFDAVRQDLIAAGMTEPSAEEVLSAILYPDVFKAFVRKQKQIGPVTKLDSPSYFQGMRIGETVSVPIKAGKTLIIQLNAIGTADASGMKTLYFTVDGQKQEIQIRDAHQKSAGLQHQLAEPTDKNQIGAPMAGKIVSVAIKQGQQVSKGDALFVIEAMKMETTVHAPFTGTVTHLYVEAGALIKSQELLAKLQPGATKQ